MKVWSNEIDWFLNHSGGALGECSNLGGFIATCERGGPGGSSEPEWNFDEREVDRAGRLFRVWKLLSHQHQRVLIAHYCGTMRSELRSKNQPSKWAKWPRGVEGQMADPPGVAILLAHAEGKLGALLEACSTSGAKGGKATIDHFEALAVVAQKLAHDAWREAARVSSPAASLARERMEVL